MRIRYADVVATLALFIALGGVGYAAITLPRDSVGSKQIRRGAVTSIEVKDRSLRARDFRRGQLPRGRRGPAGPATPATLGTGSVASEHVRNDSLTGADIDETTLGGFVRGSERNEMVEYTVRNEQEIPIEVPNIGTLTLRCFDGGTDFTAEIRNESGRRLIWIRDMSLEDYTTTGDDDTLIHYRWGPQPSTLLLGGIGSDANDVENAFWSQGMVLGTAGGPVEFEIVGAVEALVSEPGCMVAVRIQRPA